MTDSEAVIDAGMYLKVVVELLAKVSMKGPKETSNLSLEISGAVQEQHCKLAVIQANMKEIVKKIVKG